MSKWEEFFLEHNDKLIYGHEDMVHFTVEETYQAFKDRMVAELLIDIPNSGHYGKLKEK